MRLLRWIARQIHIFEAWSAARKAAKLRYSEYLVDGARCLNCRQPLTDAQFQNSYYCDHCRVYGRVKQ